MALKREEKLRRARIKYNNNYNKEHYQTISFRLSYDNESELIEFLNNFKNRKEFFTTLIKKEMKRMNKRNGKISINH